MGTTPADFDEARRCRRFGALGLLLGVLSGPVAFGVAATADSCGLFPSGMGELFGVVLFAGGTFLLILAVQIATLVHLTRPGGPRKGRRLVKAGIILTYIWSVLIFLMVQSAAYWAGSG